MKEVFVESHNILSSLGNTTVENFSRIKNGNSGVQLHNRADIDDSPFWASIISEEQFKSLSDEIKDADDYSRFEQFLIASVKDALKTSSVDVADKKTIFIFSTTKGSISLLEHSPLSPELYERINLYHSGTLVADYFKSSNKPIVISNACVSGAVAILYAKRLLESGQYENAIVAGADTVSRFVLSGFKSFQALSSGRCKPFSTTRDGINLGEAGAAVILTTKQERLSGQYKIQVSGGGVSNDSNHISGPSRTGEELSTAINKAIETADLFHEDIDFISAHGTATLYNDEMEARAFGLSCLQKVPVNSLKGYFGHTLGAAGLVESIISIQSLKEGVVIPTLGFSERGVSPEINVCDKKIKIKMSHCLKTASGFGGCNAALVFSKT